MIIRNDMVKNDDLGCVVAFRLCGSLKFITRKSHEVRARPRSRTDFTTEIRPLWTARCNPSPLTHSVLLFRETFWAYSYCLLINLLVWYVGEFEQLVINRSFLRNLIIAVNLLQFYPTAPAKFSKVDFLKSMTGSNDPAPHVGLLFFDP